jgi:hypothetical protein
MGMGGGHIAVVTPLPVLKEMVTPTASCSPCSNASSAVNAAAAATHDFSERPAGTTMITFACEKKLFARKQIAANGIKSSHGGGGGVDVTDGSLFYNDRTNL